MESIEARTRDDSASVLLATQLKLKQQPTLAGYIPTTMAPEDPSLHNGMAAAPLTESALLQLQKAQAEEALQTENALRQLQSLRGGAGTEYSPPVQSPIPPGSSSGTASSASAGGGSGGGGAVNGVNGGINSSNSLSSPFAFAAAQQQNPFPSRDVSGGSHLSQPGEDYWGAVSPRSVQSGSSNAGVGAGAGRGAGSPVPPPAFQHPAPAATAAQSAAQAVLQWQQAQQLAQQQQQFAEQQQQQAQQLHQNMYNSASSSVTPGYHMASPSWLGAQQQPSHQQQALADAAISAQRVANQKALEQQQAAAVACQAASTVAATSPADVVNRAQAALNAVQAQSVYEIASQDAINAQSRATQLQQAALTASLQPATATTAAAAALAATTAPQVQLPSQLPGVTLPPAPLVQAVVPPPSPVPSPQSSHLAQAVIAAKQTAAQKQIESQAAASAYQNAAVQAASAVEPSHVAVANAVAQQAAVIYQTAVNEAINAAATASQLEQAVASVASATAAAPAALIPTTSVPASLPLAAQVASGAIFHQTQPLPTLQQQVASSLGVLPSPALTAALGTGAAVPAALPTTAAAAAAPSPSAAVAAAVVAAQQQLQQMQLLQTTAAMQQASAFPGLAPAVSPLMNPLPTTTTANTLAGLAAGVSNGGSSGLFVTPSVVMAPSSVLGMSLGDTIGQSSLGSGMQSLMSEPQYPSIPIPPALQVATAPAAPAAAPQQQPPSPPTPPVAVKAVCSSGGSFIRGAAGSWDYEGGETRLVNIPYGCTAETLFATLERATSTLSESSELTTEYNPTLKYRLPTDPNVWVDLVDDDDVELMFDEWQDACMLANQINSSGGGATASGRINSPTYPSSVTSAGSQASASCKLHIFVQWRRPISSLGSSSVEDAAVGEGSLEGGSGSSGGNNVGAMQGEIQVITPENPEEEPAEGSDSGNANNNTEIVKSGSTNTASTSASRRQNRQRRVKSNNNKNNNPGSSSTKASSHNHAHSISIDLPDLIERMEIIQPSDISLVKFLGSGGYGDVYLGRWHGCEVAVKCLNPALFFQGGGAGGDPGAINRAAVTDLIKEADMLGSLRHPNVVWVYGMVLPASKATTNKFNHDGGFIGSGSDDSESDGEGGDGSGKRQRRRNIIDVIQAEAGTPSMMPGILRPPALVTEYMAGGSLKTALARKADIVAGPLTRIVLALDAAKGVEYLHSKRLVHFDLKSGNLLLGYRDRRPICKVADFGLAREKAQTFVSGVTSQRGTLPWIAPEILRTPDSVTEAADVYSFAIVMWELWTGREPWENTNFHALMLQLANPELKLRPPIPGTDEWDGPEGSSPPELAPGWRNLMERCWEEDPNNRPPFTQIVKELRGMISAIRPPRGGRGEGIGGGNGSGVAAPRVG